MGSSAMGCGGSVCVCAYGGIGIKIMETHVCKSLQQSGEGSWTICSLYVKACVWLCVQFFICCEYREYAIDLKVLLELEHHLQCDVRSESWLLVLLDNIPQTRSTTTTVVINR